MESEPIEVHLAQRLRQIRAKSLMSPEQFGQEMGVIRQTIQKYENGSRIPTAPFYQKLRETFNINLNWLFTGSGKMSE